MKKLLLGVFVLFLFNGMASAEVPLGTTGTLKITGVIEAKLDGVPKTIIYRKHKSGKHSVYLEIEKEDK